ncbi:MAG TPA: aspartyl protease family protein [Acidobacteriaceae bacterium]|nr:aspartyl protease family protein [Acidobacteriaceae bacterium]
MRKRNFWWLTLLTILPLANQAAAGTDTKTQALRFDLYRDYLIVARGSAGPVKGLNFLLDTGASPTVLDRHLVQKLHLEESPASIAVLDGSVEAGRAVVPDLHLGPMQKQNLSVLVEDLSFFQKALPLHIDAVIGLDVLGQVPFEIDYTSREIYFGSLPRLANSLPFQIKAGLPIAEAQVDRVPVHLLVDTGASSIILFGPSTPRPISPMRISAVNAIGEAERKQVWLHSLNLGEAKFGQEPAFMVRSRTDGNHDFDGLISPAALGITKIAIDRDRGLLSFSR